MESETLETIGLGLAAIGLIIAAMWQLSFMWLDPRKETNAEKRRREKREKKRRPSSNNEQETYPLIFDYLRMTRNSCAAPSGWRRKNKLPCMFIAPVYVRLPKDDESDQAVGRTVRRARGL